MAYTALDSLAQDLDNILDHRSCRFCEAQNCILLNNKQRIQRLHENIVFLLTFLGDFPEDAEKLKTRATNAANQARLLFHGLNKAQSVDVFNYFLKWLKKSSGQRFCRELEELILETDFICEEAMQIKCSKRSHMSSTVIGIEEDLLVIRSRICGESSELQVIPIVGMGGIGKTTLARYAYDGLSNVHHFDICVWLTISQSFHLRGILVNLVRSIKNVCKNVGEELFLLREEDYLYVDEELLKTHVYRCLKHRRYLIVMDDLWDTNVWDDLRRMFPEDLNGSRIIITTRELSVASYVDPVRQPHEMRLMDVDQSWSLLKTKVFGDEDCPPYLEEIGEYIAEKCRGLPLAIVVIAGVLSNKANHVKDSWEKIAMNVSKAVNTNDEQFCKILSLSYMHLPRHLKPCFLYMGGFPEGSEITASKLTRLWAAEGFLTSNESKEMEELGDEYLGDLARRSLVLIGKKRYDGKIKTVKIHDLLRDLCLTKSREDNFLRTINNFSGSFPPGIENSKRLSILGNISGSIPNTKSSSAHTILLFEHWAFYSWKSFRFLKVVEGLRVTYHNANYVCELIHLRYLDFTCEAIRMPLKVVSESLCKLRNLQTLIVRVFDSGWRLCSADSDYLPQSYMELEIWRMPQLRHLILLDGFLPDPSTESSSAYLVNLHRLSRIRDFKCSERVIEMIPNLKKLGIIYSYEGTYETGWSEYGLNNLVHLHRLEKLSLYAEPYPNSKDDHLSHNIAFPLSLIKLSLSGCRFTWEDMAMIGSLPNLQVLKLKRRACLGTEWRTTEGEFSELKVLLIDSTDLHEWDTESSHFPLLEHLTLYECDSLREVPNGIGDISTLELIEVDVRNLSVVESVKCIEEEQRSYGNEVLQICFLKSRSWGIITSL